MDRDEIEAFVILASIPQLGAMKIRYLVDHFGSAVEALNTPPAEIALLPGFERISQQWQSWQNDRSWQNELVAIEKYGVQLIPFTSPQFPKSLLEIPDPPALLYVQGILKPQDQRSIAVVGTRNASIYGNEMAESISRDLAANGFTVVSGLARGVDTAAHRGALERGRTLAVIGSGLTKIYPPENRALAEKISANGALITEFSMFTPPDRQNFPQRNRIVSGMTMGTVLIEAPVKSGAMITMQKAISHKKKLFALPGRVDSDGFRGNHSLIKNGEAHLIENAGDIIAHFQELFLISAVSQKKHFQLDSEEQRLFQLMPNEEIGIDTLALQTSIPIQHINRILMSLVLKQAIKEFPGKIYKKLAARN